MGASWSLSPALVWDTSLGPVIHTLSQVILSALHYKSTSDILRIGSHTRFLAFSFTLVLSIFIEYQIFRDPQNLMFIQVQFLLTL